MMDPESVLRLSNERHQRLVREAEVDRMLATGKPDASAEKGLLLRASNALITCGLWLRARSGAQPAAVVVQSDRWHPIPVLMLAVTGTASRSAHLTWWPAYPVFGAASGYSLSAASGAALWLASPETKQRQVS
jgi:hypothetical protein